VWSFVEMTEQTPKRRRTNKHTSSPSASSSSSLPSPATTKRPRTTRRYLATDAQYAIKVHAACKLEAEMGRLKFGVGKPLQRASYYTGIKPRTISQMVQNPSHYEQQIEIEVRERIPESGSDAMFYLIRKTIRKMKEKKVNVSVRNLNAKLRSKTNSGWRWNHVTLYRTLYRMGFYLKKKRTYDEEVKTRPAIKTQRLEYLVQVRAYRAEGRFLYFQDESWLNTNMTKQSDWHEHDEPDTSNVKPGKGARIILCGIGSPTEGWVGGRDGFLMFDGGKRVNRDYHGEMNWEKFSRWMKEQILPRIPSNGVIVVDRARYHLVRTAATSPPTGQKKEDLIDWLQARQIQIRDAAGRIWTNRAEMLQRAPRGLSIQFLQDLVRNNLPAPRYQLNDLIREENEKRIPAGDIKLLILPIHHPELNPIERMWGRLKKHVSENNTEPGSALRIKDLFWQEFDRITPAHWSGCMKKCLKWEKYYFKLADEEPEEDTTSPPTQIGEESSSSSEYDSDDETEI
jgi:transposase